VPRGKCAQPFFSTLTSSPGVKNNTLNALVTCGTSISAPRSASPRAALSRLERAWDADQTPAFYLDLIAYRPISGLIAEKFNVEHQSPQVLVIDKGNCTYSATHWDISMDELKPFLA
jgi:bacillithiol system protein YtxJ